MGKASKIAGTVLGSALAAIPAGKATADSEPANNTFPGESATAGVTMFGGLCLTGFSCTDVVGVDVLDFYHYTGLPAGGTFDLLFDPTSLFGPETLQAGLYTDQTTIVDFVTSTGPSDNGPLVHLGGTIPGTGELVFGITSVNAVLDEGYNITLNVTSVPAPATIALLAAGLTALGLDVARRRKRRQ